MIAKLLHEAGLYLGEESDLLPPTPDNPDGFWENVKFHDLNDEILNEFGGGWDDPPSISHEWNGKEGLLRLKARAEVVLKEFRDHEPWGWKDPRNSLTLPFWMRLLPEMKILICLRNPLEVALSLRARNFFSYSRSLTLWQIHNQLVLETTLPTNRLITHYDAYFLNPHAELRRILAFLNIPASEEVITHCCSAAKADLRHHRFTTQQLLTADVSPDVLNLYMWMCDQAGWREDGAACRASVVNASGSGVSHLLPERGGERIQEPARVWQEGTAAESGLKGRKLDKSVVDMELLRREVESLRSERVALNGKIGELQALLQEKADLIKRLEEAATAREGTIGGLEEQLAVAHRNLQEMGQVRESLLQTVNKQAGRLDEFQVSLGDASRERNDLRAALLDAREQFIRSGDELQAAIDDLQATLVASGSVQSKDIAYRQLTRRIREAVRSFLPAEATVIVASKGDGELLKLDRRKAWHFPQSEGGAYAGYYPSSSTAAIAHLEALRVKGAEFLLLPSPALWWLDHYAEFRRHLERRYPVVMRREDTCALFALRQPAVSKQSTVWTAFEDMIGEFRIRLDRDPSLLDLHTGLDLAATFPQHAIFSPPTTASDLPYLDHSIDIVAIADPGPISLAEARRVAAVAVARVSRSETPADCVHTLAVDWNMVSADTRPPTASIVIAGCNGIGYVGSCLDSLWETLPRKFGGEIILVEDGPTDDVSARLREFATGEKRLKIVRNGKDPGPAGACNCGARAATGEILIFLDHNSVVLPGWLPPLLRTFRHYPEAGVVGGKLIYPEGRLQAAGGVVFSNGSLARFGNGDYEVDAPLYNYVREVDYCPHPLLATRQSLFAELGGFDNRLGPISYADADYCFRVRERAYRAYYQPESAAVNFESLSARADESWGEERRQGMNRARFVWKWSHALKRQPPAASRLDLPTWHALAERDNCDDQETR